MVTVNTFPLLDRNALDLDLCCDSYCEMIRNQMCQITHNRHLF